MHALLRRNGKAEPCVLAEVQWLKMQRAAFEVELGKFAVADSAAHQVSILEACPAKFGPQTLGTGLNNRAGLMACTFAIHQHGILP